MSAGFELESIAGPIPGPRTKELGAALRAFESRNVTYLADDFPIFWESAAGANVNDVDGNRYIDLTAAFGVANAGHANPYVAAAIADQTARLMHAMGDVHPSETRTRLLEKLATVLPSGLNKTFLATTGAEAIEAALKTAVLATGKSKFAAFKGAYHGLSIGALSVCGIEKFREPFSAALAPPAIFFDYPRQGATDAATAIATMRETLAARSDIAAIVVEPIQGRAGCVVPPPGFLAELRELCDELQMLMVVDEIYTGFGRTGTWFAVDHEGVVPDILCIGKAMGSGFPISATVARGKVMDAWPASTGEALHTSTYLGNPMGSAAALATIGEHERLHLAARAKQMGTYLGKRLDALRSLEAVVEVRGRGMLWGIQLRSGLAAEAAVKRVLAKGVVALQAGLEGETIALTPPLVISETQLERALELLESAIRETA